MMDQTKTKICPSCGRTIDERYQIHNPNACKLLLHILKDLKAICYRDSRASLKTGDTWILDGRVYYHVVGLAYPEALKHEFCDHKKIKNGR